MRKASSFLPSIVDQSCNETCPTTLVGGAESAAGVAVKEFVEPQMVFPKRIKVQYVVAGVDASPTVVTTRKEMLQAMLEFFGHMT